MKNEGLRMSEVINSLFILHSSFSILNSSLDMP